jgi:hypothetical protein
VEEIPSVEYHVDIMLFCQRHDLVEGLPAVVLAVRISFVVSYMAVRGNQYTNGVSACRSVSLPARVCRLNCLPRCVPRALGGMVAEVLRLLTAIALCCIPRLLAHLYSSAHNAMADDCNDRRLALPSHSTFQVARRDCLG